MADKEIICAICGASHIIDLSEYNYQVNRGRTAFFCSRSCAAKYNNLSKKKPVIDKECEFCKKVFKCKPPYKVRFCSRECASRGSITPKRLEGNRKGGLNTVHGDIYSIQKLLKVREAWKYVELKKLLDSFHIEHEFEVVIGDKYIFDLCIPKWNILIEFDGTYHNSQLQIESDKDKSDCAEQHGYKLIRVVTADNVVIPASVIYDIVSQHLRI